MGFKEEIIKREEKDFKLICDNCPIAMKTGICGASGKLNLVRTLNNCPIIHVIDGLSKLSPS